MIQSKHLLSLLEKFLHSLSVLDSKSAPPEASGTPKGTRAALEGFLELHHTHLQIGMGPNPTPDFQRIWKRGAFPWLLSHPNAEARLGSQQGLGEAIQPLHHCLDTHTKLTQTFPPPTFLPHSTPASSSTSHSFWVGFAGWNQHPLNSTAMLESPGQLFLAMQAQAVFTQGLEK